MKKKENRKAAPDTTKSMVISGPLPEGAELRFLAPKPDHRGVFTELLCESWSQPITPSQWSVVSSKARVLRGMHIHARHDELICVVQGSASVGLFDLRGGSGTANASCMVLLSSKQPACLTFQAGTLHGWYFFEPSMHVQAVSEEYDTYAMDDNQGCHWSDPELGLDWYDSNPILSERAASFPPLSRLRRGYGSPAN